MAAGELDLYKPEDPPLKEEELEQQKFLAERTKDEAKDTSEEANQQREAQKKRRESLLQRVMEQEAIRKQEADEKMTQLQLSKEQADAKEALLLGKIAALEADLRAKQAQEKEGHRRGRPPNRDGSTDSRGSKRSRDGSLTGKPSLAELRMQQQQESANQGGGDRPSQHQGRRASRPYSYSRNTEAGREGYRNMPPPPPPESRNPRGGIGVSPEDSTRQYPWVRSYAEAYGDHPPGERPGDSRQPPHTPRYNMRYGDNPEGVAAQTERKRYEQWRAEDRMNGWTAGNPGFPEPEEFPYQRLPPEHRTSTTQWIQLVFPERCSPSSPLLSLPRNWPRE